MYSGFYFRVMMGYRFWKQVIFKMNGGQTASKLRKQKTNGFLYSQVTINKIGSQVFVTGNESSCFLRHFSIANNVAEEGKTLRSLPNDSKHFTPTTFRKPPNQILTPVDVSETGQSALISSDSEMCQSKFSTVHHLKIPEQPWLSPQQERKWIFPVLKVSAVSALMFSETKLIFNGFKVIFFS